MLTPIKIKLTLFEAEALRKYCMHMLSIALNRPKDIKGKFVDLKAPVISIAEYAPGLHTKVQRRVFENNSREATYKIPISTARHLWYRMQQDVISFNLQLVFSKIDKALLNANHRPDFEHTTLNL